MQFSKLTAIAVVAMTLFAPGAFAQDATEDPRQRALASFEAGDFPTAFATATTFLAREPDDIEMLAVAAQADPSAASGLKFVDRAIALEPDGMTLHLIRAVLLLGIDDVPAALASAETALKLEPGDAYAMNLKGYAYLAMGDYVRAERAYAALARAHPDDADARAGLAAVHLAMGRGDAALAEIEFAERLDPSWNSAEARSRAEKVIHGHRALSPAAIRQIEADRDLVLGAIARHLRATCGEHRLPRFSANLDTDAMNADLVAHRDCLTRWQAGQLAIHDSLSAAELAAGDRLYDAHSAIVAADELRCSRMPKRSTCVPDELHARGEAASGSFHNPVDLVVAAEVERLNGEIATFNKSVDRHNTGAEVAGFVQELARALNEQ